MNDLQIHEEIRELIYTYKLGEIIGNPKSVLGGYMHKMYKVKTTTNIYAVKWLNPSIMKRDEAMDNMIHSERIADAFSAHVNVVAARCFDGSYVLPVYGHYYMVYDWLEGASIFPPVITEGNCYEIGKALGKMHSLDINLPEVQRGGAETVSYDWEGFLEYAIKQKATWIDDYANIINKLILWTEQVNNADIQLSRYMVISHRDLDPKNVMWCDNTPYFIDWESASYVNPYQELIEVLIYWSDNGEGGLSRDNFRALLNAYTQYISIKDINIEIVLGSGYAGMLGWLEYNLKRALGIESQDSNEQKLGEEQIIETISVLEKYNKQTALVRSWMV